MFIKVTEIDLNKENKIVKKEKRINTDFIIDYSDTKIGEINCSWIRTMQKSFAVWESPETLDNLVGTVGI